MSLCQEACWYQRQLTRPSCKRSNPLERIVGHAPTFFCTIVASRHICTGRVYTNNRTHPSLVILHVARGWSFGPPFVSETRQQNTRRSNAATASAKLDPHEGLGLGIGLALGLGWLATNDRHEVLCRPVLQIMG